MSSRARIGNLIYLKREPQLSLVSIDLNSMPMQNRGSATCTEVKGPTIKMEQQSTGGKKSHNSKLLSLMFLNLG